MRERLTRRIDSTIDFILRGAERYNLIGASAGALTGAVATSVVLACAIGSDLYLGTKFQETVVTPETMPIELGLGLVGGAIGGARYIRQRTHYRR